MQGTSISNKWIAEVGDIALVDGGTWYAKAGDAASVPHPDFPGVLLEVAPSRVAAGGGGLFVRLAEGAAAVTLSGGTALSANYYTELVVTRAQESHDRQSRQASAP